MKDSIWFYRLVAPVALLLMIVVSCGLNNPEITAVETPTKQNAVLLVTQTLEVPLASPTSDHSTATMEPTFAYWATAQQVRFSSIYTQIAQTKSAISTYATLYPQFCGFNLEGVFTSPDAEWIASDCKYDKDEFRVFRVNGKTTWNIPLSDLFEDYPNDVGSVNVVYWSQDGKYLYFANRACCADVDATTNGDNLYRLNLQSGKWASLISGYFNYYSFSPDGQTMLYILNNQSGANVSIKLHLLDINSGKEELIEAGDYEQAWVYWNSNGQKIVLGTQTGSIYMDDRKFGLVFVDLQKKETRTIIPLSEDGAGIFDWSDDDVLAIRKSHLLEYNGYYVSSFETLNYDLKTNEFIEPASQP